MPEGDTLHRIANAAAPRLVGRAVRQVEAPRLAADLRGLVGTTITRVEARGKYLVIIFDEAFAILTHLRMTGKWHLYAPGEPWRRSRHALRVLVEVEGTVACCFSAPVVRLLRAKDLERVVGAGSLGPDVLGPSFDVDAAIANLRAGGDTAIGEALLDQARVSGIGNVWKSELLFRERLDPFAPVASFSDEALRALLERARVSMHAVVAQRPRLRARAATAHYAYTRDSSAGPRGGAREGEAQGAGTSGSVLATGSARSSRTTRSGCEVGKGPIAVYGRAGSPCGSCGAAIRMERQGRARRSTYFCPSCQRGA
jgi:endonuclease-8